MLLGYDSHAPSFSSAGEDMMLTLGTIDYDIWPDQWTAVTKDRKRTAQFEHTIVVTETGSEILTLA